MIQSRTVTLPTADHPEGESFTISQLPAMRGVRLFTRLGKVLGPALAQVGKVLSSSGGLDTIELDALAPALGALFSNLEADVVEQLLRELFATVKVGTQDLLPVFDAKFAGRFDSVLKLAGASLEVQFGNFFGDLAARAKALASKPQPASGTSSTLTGPSIG